MLKQVFIWVAVALLLLVLILFFLNGGGFRAIAQSAHSIPSLKAFLLGEGSSFQLPGQSNALSQLGIQVDTSGGNASYQAPPSSEVSAPSMGDSGTPSPYAGTVSLGAGNAQASSPQAEYLTLTASGGNTALVDISGWSLQSAISGTRAYIPLAASPFVLGIVNRVADTMLSPGAGALFVSGISPIGVSFRETLCTGYLNQMQSFTPALSNSCPSSDRILPATAENIARYGADCFQFMHSLPQCDFPSSLPTNLSGACRAFLATSFSYNGCVNQFQSATDFALPSYRLYGSFTRELWGNNHDTVRLLDAQGRTVDAVSY